MIFTNQLRQKIGVMFGNPETTTGGMALKFYASVRLDIRRIESVKAGSEATGNHVRVTVKKNKVAPPFRVAEFDIMFNEGISKAGSVLDIGTEMGIVEKRGAFFSYEGQRLAQGRENAKEFLKANPDLLARIERQVRDQAGLGKVVVTAAGSEDLSDAELEGTPLAGVMD
jgi:recombination protein RecA